MSANDVLDEGLSRLAATGPEYRGGLSNHGPMAAEALVRLGRADAVEPWLDGYLKRLDGPPRPADRITDAIWRDALGRPNRVADWEVYLRAELAEEPWRDEHAIKLTEACLRLHAESPDPVFLHAAARASDLLAGR